MKVNYFYLQIGMIPSLLQRLVYFTFTSIICAFISKVYDNEQPTL